LILVAVFALCWRVWTPIANAQRAFPWDAQWEYWGDIAFQVNAWRDGEPPVWDPYDRCGYPFAADPQAGVLYPVTWLLVALGLLGGAKFWLVTAKTMFHMWWWAFGTAVWLRRRGTPMAACTAAGLLCLLAYPTNAWFSALNWGMAWTPWVLAAIDGFAAAPGRRGAAWLGLALGMTFLAGAPASFWYMLLVAIPYGGWALVHHGRGQGRAYAAQVARAGALAAALFLALVAGQVLATSALLPHTVRAERSFEFIADSVLHADDLLGMVVPRMPGIDLYLGVIWVLAAAAGLTLRPSGRGFVLGAIAVAGVLLAIGSGAGYLPSLASFLPMAGFFRKAHRYTYVSILPVAALGAEGLAVLLALDARDQGRRVGRAFVALGAGAALVFGVGAVATRPGAQHDAWVFALFSWALSAWLLRQLVVGAPAWRPRFVGLAATLLAFDVWFARAPTLEAAWWPVPQTPLDGDAARLPGVPLEARLFDREYFKYRAGPRLGLRDLGGYEGDPLALRRYAELLDDVYRDPHLLGHANVRYVVGEAGPRPMKLGADFKPLRARVAETPAVAPAVAWYGGARLVADEPAAAQALRELTPGKVALLEEQSLDPGERAQVAQLGGASDVVAGRIVAFGRTHLVAEVDAPRAGVVVVAESYHPGWSATVDGQPAHIVPANLAFRGLLVGPGAHRIELRFHLGPAGWLMLLSPLAFVVGLALALRRERQRAGGGTPQSSG
jgi:hypothetical protein